jgi:hypothetical protein
MTTPRTDIFAEPFTRRQALRGALAATPGLLLCRLPLAGPKGAPDDDFTYGGIDARITHLGNGAKLAVRKSGAPGWQDKDQSIFMRGEDGLYSSCMMCTGTASRNPHDLVRLLIDAHRQELFYLV